jgi:hypothetical protein
MRILVLSVTIGMLLAACGGAIGLAVGGLLVGLDWLADPGRGIVFMALMLVPASLFGIYGFVSARDSLQKRESLANSLRQVAVMSTVACGGLLLKGASILVPVQHYERASVLATQDQVIVLVAGLLGLGFVLSLAAYAVLVRNILCNEGHRESLNQ